jgi:hypothetical protein
VGRLGEALTPAALWRKYLRPFDALRQVRRKAVKHIAAEGVRRRVLLLFAKGDQTRSEPRDHGNRACGQSCGRIDLLPHRPCRGSQWGRTSRTPADSSRLPPPPPPPGVEKNGHNFLVRMNSPRRTGIARAAQEQVARFLASGGIDVIDPDTVGLVPSPNPPQPAPLLFEEPIEGALPEDLNFIP